MFNPKQWQGNGEIPCIGGSGFDSTILMCILSKIKSMDKIALQSKTLRLIVHADL